MRQGRGPPLIDLTSGDVLALGSRGRGYSAAAAEPCEQR